ncbi:MAG: Mur ligase domain-containing protein [Deltaproteobacteria bacterium]|jgi:UDP-N-acetylmuramate: L-alanyl-gamma-D-glutamyl-meso-diaminopimelate ligase|nr:Mur ligase domain-containing protein [Deltaproteobacteria bacterium]
MELAKNLNRLPGKVNFQTHFHLIGIGGVAMTALAGLLKQEGYKVTGSDENLYPPMKDILARLELTVCQGYGPETLPPDSVAVVGNVVTRKFPVIETLMERGQYYVSLPQLMGELFLAETKNLVISGCHGKTTVTNLAAALMENLGLKPGFLIGGQSLDLPRAYEVPLGEWFIIEGDEYDSAFFQKVPKFIFYKPRTVILTGVEFDHGDIYPDLASVTDAYRGLIELIPPEGLLLANGDDPICRELARLCRGRVEFYGQVSDNDWVVTDYRAGESFSFNLKGPGVNLALSWSRPGLYNALNAAAALAFTIRAGADPGQLPIILSQLRGVKRRQEVLGNFGGVRVIDDFAHHPTAVLNTLIGLKSDLKGRLVAVFEPRSNTTRRAVFQNAYQKALAAGDLVFLAGVNQPDKAPPDDRLDPLALVRAIGPKARYCPEPGKLLAELMAALKPGDTVVLMSNGDFGDLARKLTAGLSSR